MHARASVCLSKIEIGMLQFIIIIIIIIEWTIGRSFLLFSYFF